jgi:enoyl-CoA hydratase/carnithine racemase
VVEKMADKIMDYDPIVVSYAKQAVTRGLDLPLSQGLELEARLGCGLLS